jgi:hypothetical protein
VLSDNVSRQVKPPLVTKLRKLVVGSRDRDGQDPERSSYERFAIPYSFKPSLSLPEALISVCGAFLRIVVGSLLFGIWGTYSFLAWSSIHNVILRYATLLALISAFALAMTCIMLAISTGVRMVWPQRPARH